MNVEQVSSSTDTCSTFIYENYGKIKGNFEGK